MDPKNDMGKNFFAVWEKREKSNGTKNHTDTHSLDKEHMALMQTETTPLRKHINHKNNYSRERPTCGRTHCLPDVGQRESQGEDDGHDDEVGEAFAVGLWPGQAQRLVLILLVFSLSREGEILSHGL